MYRAPAVLAFVLMLPLAAHAQNGVTSLEKIAAALGASGVKSLEITATGTMYQVGQNATPTMPWPKFNIPAFARSVNYGTASMRDALTRTQANDPPRGGGTQPIRGEQKLVWMVSGDHAWNVAGDNAIPAPITLAERQFQLWATPQGFVKAAMANTATVKGRTVLFAVPGRFRAKATVDARDLIEKIEAVLPSTVTGDMAYEVRYTDYQDFGGVKFPAKIQQSAGGFPTWELTVTAVTADGAVDIAVPDGVRQATKPYSTVTTQMAAEGVWFLSGGTHNSAVIEMKDYLILVEAPLNDERALAVLAETRDLVPNKPVRYVINSHHHFDHAGGLRAVAGEGITIITHDVNRAFLQKALAARATIAPDHAMTSGKKAVKVEGFKDRRVLTDGTRTVEIRHIGGNLHHDGLMMVYLRQEKILIEADAYTPLPPNAPVPTPPNPFSVSLAENLERQKLDVDRVLPLHGRIVPLAELHKAIGHPR